MGGAQTRGELASALVWTTKSNSLEWALSCSLPSSVRTVLTRVLATVLSPAAIWSGYTAAPGVT